LESNPDIIKFQHEMYAPPQEQFYLEV